MKRKCARQKNQNQTTLTGSDHYNSIEQTDFGIVESHRIQPLGELEHGIGEESGVGVRAHGLSTQHLTIERYHAVTLYTQTNKNME